jgi:hypothetical protein
MAPVTVPPTPVTAGIVAVGTITPTVGAPAPSPAIADQASLFNLNSFSFGSVKLVDRQSRRGGHKADRERGRRESYIKSFHRFLLEGSPSKKENQNEYKGSERPGRHESESPGLRHGAFAHNLSSPLFVSLMMNSCLLLRRN